jgi:hypothetical protein
MEPSLFHHIRKFGNLCSAIKHASVEGMNIPKVEQPGTNGVVP